MNWKSFVETAQAKEYVLPEGWDSREKVATDLGISEDAVQRMFSPLVKSGVIEMGSFPVFDKILKRVVKITAYRKKNQQPAQKLTRGKNGQFK